MNIGVPKEVRPYEYRVGLPPAGVQMLTKRGHVCYIEHNAGEGAGFSDQDYEQAGGKIVYSAHEALGRADLVLKIARPLITELELVQPGAIIIGALHLPSAHQGKIDYLLENKITTLAYEQIELEDGTRPVLHPMSKIGGYLAAQTAAHLMQNNAGGKGILLGGMPGVPPAEVVIIGAGVFGSYATQAFLGMGAQVTILDVEFQALQRIHDQYPQVVTMHATKANIEKTCTYGDVIIAAAARPGEPAPTLITRNILGKMKSRSLVMDVSIDQGGCVETSRPTTHDQPTFVESGIIHYCVPNMSSVLARTASHALYNAARPFILKVIEKGLDSIIEEEYALAKAINTYNGEIYHLIRFAPSDQGTSQ